MPMSLRLRGGKDRQVVALLLSIFILLFEMLYMMSASGMRALDCGSRMPARTPRYSRIDLVLVRLTLLQNIYLFGTFPTAMEEEAALTWSTGLSQNTQGSAEY